MENQTRIDAAQASILAMHAHYGDVVDGDEQTDLVDLLTNLRHFADAHNCDFHGAVDWSYRHYLEEKHV